MGLTMYHKTLYQCYSKYDVTKGFKKFLKTATVWGEPFFETVKCTKFTKFIQTFINSQ